MLKSLRICYIFSLLCMVLLLTVSAFPVIAVNDNGSRFSGSVSVPQWNVGDKWGYKIPQYTYASTYFGVGFEVVGSEMVNGYDCYDVKIWWDVSYGSEEVDYDLNFEIPGISYSYKYEGHVYLTKEKLAIARFTLDLQMRNKFDGSEFDLSSLNYNSYTRGQDLDYTDYSKYLEEITDWKYDISYSFGLTYDYNPPFVMYDYPLELNKKWTSTSEIEVTWEYSTHSWMNDAMKNYMQELSGENFIGFNETEDEEGSDSTKFTLSGEFEVTGEDTIITDAGTFQVFIIEYDITPIFTRQTYSTPPSSYSGMSMPGGDSTLSIIGGTSGSGSSYFDPESGYPQQVVTGDSYYSKSFSTVDAESVENSYNKLEGSFNSDDKSSDSSGSGSNITILVIIAFVAGFLICLFFAIILFTKKKIKKYEEYSQYQIDDPYRQSPPIQ